MLTSTYQEIRKDKIEFAIQQRFAAQIKQLYALGFTVEFYLCEAWFPFSALALSPMLVTLFAMGEIVRVGGMLRVMVFNPFLVHQDGYAYAKVMKIGINYMTLFDDGTILKTPTFNPGLLGDRENGYIVEVGIHNPALTFETAWRQHAWKIKRLMGDGRTPVTPLTIMDIMRYEAQIDRLSFGFQRGKLPITLPKQKSADL